MCLPRMDGVQDVDFPEDEIVNVMTCWMHTTDEGTGEIRVEKIACQSGPKVFVQKRRQELKDGVFALSKRLAARSQGLSGIRYRRQPVAVRVEDVKCWGDIC